MYMQLKFNSYFFFNSFELLSYNILYIRFENLFFINFCFYKILGNAFEYTLALTNLITNTII